jgi:hypothetical protein
MCFTRQIFCDFGQDFQVVDTNGEAPLTQIVTEISHVCIIVYDYTMFINSF